MVSTKRTILSEISKVFEPLGWVSPAVIIAKLLIQRLWHLQLGWDTPVHDDLVKIWVDLRDQLHVLSEIKIPRWVGTSETRKVELHGFADASEKAYAAVVYVRLAETGAEPQIVVAKTKVAPLKIVSLPRLELNAALLLSRLMKQVNKIFNVNETRVHYWSDSMITLAWIRDHPRKRKAYVANRVSEIQTNTNLHRWFHVRSADNLADLGSRGVMPELLKGNELWWHGPTFLKTFELNDYSSSALSHHIELPAEENKQAIHIEGSKPTMTITTMIANQKRSVVEVVTNIKNIDLLNRYSTLSKLCRVVAYCLRWKKPNRTTHTYVDCNEYDHALKVVLQMVQRECFLEEIKNIKTNKNLSKKSSLCSLNPTWDEDDSLLRVSSRLERSDNLSFDQKFPIILPHGHIISSLIVREAHVKTLHGTLQRTWMMVNQRYHIIKCKDLIRNISHQCVKCTVHRHRTQCQQMAPLPPSRTSPAKPFQVTGVDLAGPFEIKKWKIKCNRWYKAYFAIFVCFSTRAIHLEVVLDLSTSEFIQAYIRFIGRRGIPSHLHSDNGTNFVGAKGVVTRQRNEYLQKWNEEIAKSLSPFNTEWHFNPPSSPHFGGLWEAGVKSAKYHLKRIMGQTRLSYDEFETVLVQVESCLISRPLCSIDGNPDSEVLTPGHFLVQAPLNALPQKKISSQVKSRLDRWQHLQRMLQHFWKLWSSEYINTLRQRQKWRKPFPNVKENDVVIVKEDSLPPNMWNIARVVKTHCGSDGLIVLRKENV